MKATPAKILAFVLLASVCLLPAQTTDFSKTQVQLDSATDLQVMLEALASVKPVAFDSLPKNKRGDVMASGYHSFRHPEWPPLPCNFYHLPVWPLGSGSFVLDDRELDYTALDEAADLDYGGAQMRMMSSSLSSYAYGNGVYLTNLVVTSVGGVSVAFDIAGGTNNVPYDIQMTTNLVSAWNWLGIGYTSNRYTFTGQPSDTAFYRLAKPSRTMTVGWGENTDLQTDVPLGLTNAVMVTGGYYQGLALLTDGTIKSWGDGYYTSQPTNLTGVTMIAGGWNHNVALLTNGTVIAWGYNGSSLGWHLTDVPPDLTNVTVISAQEIHSLALRTNGTVVAWGDNAHGETNVPTGLSNVVAIAAGGEHNLAVKADGTVIAWGNNANGQTNVPSGVSNVWDVAAGFNHSVALKKDGTVICWGGNNFGQTVVPGGLSDVVAIAAGGYATGSGYTLALKKDGTLVVWGKNKIAANLNGLNQVIAIGGGFDYGFAIRTGPPTPVILLQPTNQFQAVGGTVSFSGQGQGLYGVTYQWQTNGVNFAGATNSTLTLTNVSLAQAGSYRLMVTDNGGYGSIASSNASLTLVTPPVFTYQSTPTNIVTIYGKNLNFTGTAIAPGTTNGFPISYRWQLNGTNLAGITTNAYGFTLNDVTPGTYTLIASNAAGSASISWQAGITNFVDVTQDLLLVYNTNSTDSTTCLNYYLAHRPNVSGANVLGIGYTNPATPTYFETVTPQNLTNQIFNPLLNLLTNNPTKRPQYVILFMDLPSRCNNFSDFTTNAYSSSGVHSSVSVQLNSLVSDWQPYVTHLNMGMGTTNTSGRTNDCIAYINKLAGLGVPAASNSPILSASLGGYGNTNYILDGVRFAIASNPGENFSGAVGIVSNTIPALLAAGVSSNAIHFYDSLIVSNYQIMPNVFLATHLSNGVMVNVTNYGTFRHATNAANVAGYVSWGVHANISARQTVDGTYAWYGDSGWYLINTIESHNGKLIADLDHGQGSVSLWYSSTAFGGTNYGNTPAGSVSTVDEPGSAGAKNDSSVYFGLWASGKNFGICAWNSKVSQYFQAVGDPLIEK